jgi:hypothetical protein
MIGHFSTRMQPPSDDFQSNSLDIHPRNTYKCLSKERSLEIRPRNRHEILSKDPSLDKIQGTKLDPLQGM